MEKITMLVLDCETNGLTTNYSVLSASAIKFEYDKESKQCTILSEFDRYYYPKERYYNENAIRVNGLTEKIITEKRKGVKYAEFFTDDKDWDQYIEDVDYFIGHNLIMFDSKFMLDNRLKYEPKDLICTMLENVEEVKAEFPYSYYNDYPEARYKWPTLLETAIHYNIILNKKELHSSLYDCEITLEIFKKMIEKELIVI
jgi:DNA polymerase III epsilon subunit-like protein